ncbi:MAG: hypothetical protein ACI9BK_003215 [Acidimicrobiales bacterium]|jgi:hypothetical protein
MAHVVGFEYGALVAPVVRRSRTAAKQAFTQPCQTDGTAPVWDSTGGYRG